jgi:hypothetical protein
MDKKNSFKSIMHKERCKKCKKKYKKIHTKCSYYSNSWWIINLFFNW